MIDILFFASVLVPIITGLVEVIKRAVNLPINVIPVIALVVGLVVGFASSPFSDLELTIRLWAGVLAALAASGLFELVKQRDGYTKDGE